MTRGIGARELSDATSRADPMSMVVQAIRAGSGTLAMGMNRQGGLRP
jgi:hypothetical protein